MSLVSSFVLFDNGKWYRDPTIRGDDYFICWDDDDPCELVVKAEKGQGKKYYHDVVKIKVAHLAEEGLKLHLTSSNSQAFRWFCDDLKQKPDYAVAWFVDVKSKVPAKFAPARGGMSYWMEDGGCYYFPGWTEQEARLLDKKFRAWLEKSVVQARDRLGPTVPLNQLYGLGKQLDTQGKISQADPPELSGDTIVCEYERTRKKVP